MTPPFSPNFYLVGGTALALHIGHRESIDLDLFSEIEFESDVLFEELKNIGKLEINRNTKAILNLSLDGIKLDFVYYRYPIISKLIEKDNIRLASLEDIAAMKIAAIIGRGTKKDFIDIYFLIKKFTLKKILDFYLEKYPDGSYFMALKSITYFLDADPHPMPEMFIPVSWEEIKTTIVRETKENI